MPRGGARPGAGRPQKPKSQDEASPIGSQRPPAGDAPWKTPLEHMVAVMNDPTVEAARRDRMAIAAAPYVHARAESKMPGKKEAQGHDAAEAASSGPFTPGAKPRLAVDNT